MRQAFLVRRLRHRLTFAAWKQAARAEVAAASDEKYAQVLLDLVKAFDRRP